MKKYVVVVLTLLVSTLSMAREYQGGSKRTKNEKDGTAANCAPAVSSSELSINNVRALIHTGGDMWWDLVGVPRYEVPKESGRTSLFAGSLWLGGRDASGQLKVAALRFRQVGVDFWTGPLSTVTAEIDPSTCEKWDKHFKSTRREVDVFVSDPNAPVPNFIKEWPAHGDPANDEDTYLAPFIDVDGDGYYNWENGDYPGYDITGKVDCQGKLVYIYGDENLWWVFNDKGNIHTETGGQAIGMEIRAQAFSFATNDEVNNMTFYNYELHNRSSFDLQETYFGFWVDPDLGSAADDYVGCDVERGLGYCYNGDELDDDISGRPGYGTTPPAIGVDFFQGPFQDSDGKDNCLCTNYVDAILDDGIVYSGSGVGYGDTYVDNERLGMRAYLYFNNERGSPTGDPQVANDYYNYLRSIWKDNTRMVYGGTGHQNSPGVVQPLVEADFMFPDASDPLGWGTGGVPQAPWTEVTANNTPGDRRFVQSAGPFVLSPGAVNNITVGVVWARANTGGAEASIQTLKQADTKTQALFDNCFQLLDGPDAPVVTIQEYDKQLVFHLDNVAGNNVNESYFEIDPFIVAPDTLFDDNGNPVDKTTDPVLFDSLSREYRSYRFQGYQVFQLRDASVSAADLYDNDKARLVFQCDIRDDVTRLINYRFDRDLQAIVPELRVDVAANNGVYKTFTVTEDAFAEGDRTLVNYRTYYYMAIAYAYNNYKTYNQTDPSALDGQKAPYLPSRKSPTGPIIRYSAIPHMTDMQNQGQILRSSYGEFIPITRIEGIGNMGHFLEMDQASIDEAMSGPPYRVANPTYIVGDNEGSTGTPIEVKVVDPLQVKPGDYTLYFYDITDDGSLSDALWFLLGDNLADTVFSESSIMWQKEEVVPELGISITIKDVENAGYDKFTNGFISSRIVYEDFNKQWLSGVPDTDGNEYQNWIRSGKNAEENKPEYYDYGMLFSNGIEGKSLDPDEYFETVLEGTWAPFRLATWNTHGPAANRVDKPFSVMFNGYPHQGDNPAYQLGYLNSVDIVFTSDKSKWTRCVVVEMQDDPALAVGGAIKLNPRASASVDKNGLSAGEAGYNPAEGDLVSSTGMGWFPGYAIDIETGERLNIAFGEDSYLVSENGSDMIWNPTDIMYEGIGSNRIRFGGKHYIFVFRNNDVEEDVYTAPNTYNDPANRMPAYDEGKFMIEKLSTGDKTDYENVYRAAMWVGFPLLQFNEELLSNKAVVQIRVNKAFDFYSPGQKYSVGDALESGVEYLVEKGPIMYNGVTYKRGKTFIGVDNTTTILMSGQTGTDVTDNVSKTINGGRPTYRFSLNGLDAIINNNEVAVNSLDLIRVVPNPYYAYSEYETDKNDNIVKITNLPGKCRVRIFTLNGVLVREFTKDDDSVTYIDWNLKNHARIPVASGMYLIHVEVPGVGETVLKWFGAMRPVDLDSF